MGSQRGLLGRSRATPQTPWPILWVQVLLLVLGLCTSPIPYGYLHKLGQCRPMAAPSSACTHTHTEPGLAHRGFALGLTRFACRQTAPMKVLTETASLLCSALWFSMPFTPPFLGLPVHQTPPKSVPKTLLSYAREPYRLALSSGALDRYTPYAPPGARSQRCFHSRKLVYFVYLKVYQLQKMAYSLA